ncbi:MAG: protein translocase subunit SecF [Clostridiales bacterium]|nr:protein translocase subunit SecF [Clostridiales bacterium]
MKSIIHFYEKRFIYFAISALIMLAGIVAIFINGVQLDIQFKGGAIITYAYTGDVNSDDAAKFVQDKLGRTVSAQVTKDVATGEKRLVLNLAGSYGLEASKKGELDTALKQKYPSANLTPSKTSMVEPFFGKKFLTNGIIALILASVLIVFYVWLRFRRISGLSAGVMALVALFHDLLMVFFTCVLFKIPLGESFVAVSLTILGYSINDTIVIYDRIRENARFEKKLAVEELVNKSITQSFARSINTTLTVVISLVIIYVFAAMHGIESIEAFALPMTIGAITGCYSTICIAGPLWVMWQKHQQKYNPRKMYQKG